MTARAEEATALDARAVERAEAAEAALLSAEQARDAAKQRLLASEANLREGYAAVEQQKRRAAQVLCTCRRPRL